MILNFIYVDLYGSGIFPKVQIVSKLAGFATTIASYANVMVVNVKRLLFHIVSIYRQYRFVHSVTKHACDKRTISTAKTALA